MYVDKDLFTMCMYLDKIYEGEGTGARVFSNYLDAEPRFDVVKKFTLRSHIDISDMNALPAFLSSVWVLEKIYEKLRGLFSVRSAFAVRTAELSSLSESDTGITDILLLFSSGERRTVFTDPSRYQELLTMYARLDTALARIEAMKAPVFLVSEPVDAEAFLAGKYTVISSRKSSIRDISSHISFSGGTATARGNGKKIMITADTVHGAKDR